MSDKPSSRNQDGVYQPFSAELPPETVHNTGRRFGIRYRELGEYGGATHVGVVLEVLDPGKQSNPLHYHMLEEEHLYVLEGTMTVLLGDRRYPVSPGDYVCFPAGQKVGHALLNEGSAPCRYLAIGERNPSDVIVYTESGRVSVRLTGEGYRKSATMEYWEGEKLE